MLYDLNGSFFTPENLSIFWNYKWMNYRMFNGNVKSPISNATEMHLCSSGSASSNLARHVCLHASYRSNVRNRRMLALEAVDFARYRPTKVSCRCQLFSHHHTACSGQFVVTATTPLASTLLSIWFTLKPHNIHHQIDDNKAIVTSRKPSTHKRTTTN